MKRLLLTFSICLFLCVGCEKKGRIEFINVVQDHNELIAETNDALIVSIRDDMQGITDPDARKGAEELIERLETLKDQGKIINEYVFTEIPDQELLARLLKSKWKGTRNVAIYR